VRKGAGILMARSRNIKPGFFENEYLAELGPYCQLLFAGLWTIADREGRLEDRPARIKAQVFPYYNSLDANELLDKLFTGSKHEEFIIRYEVDGEKYIWIPKFLNHQKPHPKEKKSTIPPFSRNAVKLNGDTVKSNLITQTSPAGSSDSLISDSLTPLHTESGNEPKKVVDVVCEGENLKELEDLRSKILGNPFPSPKDLQGMDEMVKLMPVRQLKIIIETAYKDYKPKYDGDKIRTFTYFLPIIQKMAATLKSRVAPEEQKPIIEQSKESIELTQELIDLIPEWMAKEALNHGVN
jgi:hypothetical protein